MNHRLAKTSFGIVRADWPLVPLPEVAFFQEGPGLRRWQWTTSGMKVINGTNVLTDGRFDVDNTSRFISLDEFQRKYAHFAVESGDIVVVSSGSIGKVSRIRPQNLPLMMNTSVIRFHPRVSNLDANYLHAYLRAPLFQNQVTRFAIGVAQLNFGPAHLKQTLIPVPPIGTQWRIGAIISEYDELIENNTRRIAILEEMARSLYREWFVNFRFPGHHHVEMVDSPIGTIPSGWEPRTLTDIAADSRRSIQPQNVEGNTPYVGLEHLPRRSIVLQDWGEAASVQSTKLSFDKGDILFGKIRPYFHKVSVAPVSGVCSSDTIVITPKESRFFGLTVTCVSSDDFVAHATQTSQGTKMPRANWDVLLKYPVPLPPVPLLERFEDLVSDILGMVMNVVMRNRALRQCRDLLLPRLISGDLDVSDRDIDTGELSA